MRYILYIVFFTSTLYMPHTAKAQSGAPNIYKTARTAERAADDVVFQKIEELRAGNAKLLLATGGIAILLIVVSYALFRNQAKVSDRRNKIIEEKNLKIMDSMKYARKIQNAILPDAKELQGLFKDYFIIIKSIDVVSGDFIWFSKAGGYFFIAVVDCSGHGVPGAFLSMIGHAMLNRIIIEEKKFETDEILESLAVSVSTALRSEFLKENANDIMHVSICRIGLETPAIQFSGAGNPAYYIANGGFGILKGNSCPIGCDDRTNAAPFLREEIRIEGAASLYLTTEGFYEGRGKNPAAIKALQTGELIRKVCAHPFDAQKNEILAEMEKYPVKSLQSDDFTIFGIRVG